MGAPVLHLIGEGRLAVPPAESDSRRYGTVVLLDEHGNPKPLQELTPAGAAVLTASIAAPTARELGRRAGAELLGVGALFFERTSWNERPALAAGVRPSDGRQAWWLEPSTLAGLQGVPVLLEVHDSWPGCWCKPAEFKPRRRKRYGSKNKQGRSW
jgi:hypothetical protein